MRYDHKGCDRNYHPGLNICIISIFTSVFDNSFSLDICSFLSCLFPFIVLRKSKLLSFEEISSHTCHRSSTPMMNLPLPSPRPKNRQPL